MMSNRLDEYFAGEAGDYLDQLHALLSDSSSPDADGLLRLAMGVRGSTKMAGADSISRLAGRLEDAARSIAGLDLPWGDDVLDVARSTVTEIRDLVGSIPTWGPAEDERVQRCLERWSEVQSGQDDPDASVVPIDSLFYDDDGPHIIEPVDDSGILAIPVVPIESLFLRGDAAIRQALSLRPEFDAAVRADSDADRPLASLVEELFDLLDLSLTPDLPEA